jgi:hypothetical protein
MFVLTIAIVPQGSFTFFAPTIVTGLGYQSVQAQLLTVPPWAVGFVVAITLSYSADYFDARGWHIAVASTIGGIGWLTAGLLPADAFVARYGCLCMAACGAFPCAPSLTNWVTCNSPSLLVSCSLKVKFVSGNARCFEDWLSICLGMTKKLLS